MLHFSLVASLWLAAPTSAVEAPVVVKLIENLADDDDVRRGAARRLGKMGPEAKEALPVLKSVAVKDQDSSVRAAAKQAIDHIHGLPQIIEVIQNGKRSERAAAAKALGALGEDGNAATEKLVEAMFFWEPASRDEFLDALEKMNPRVHPPIAVLLRDQDPSHQLAAVQEIRRLPQDGATTVSALLSLYHSSTHPPQRSQEWEKLSAVTLAALAKVAPEDQRVVGLVKTTVVEIRAVKGKIPEMARWLRDLDSPEFAVREYASEVLGEAGAEIEEALREHLSATPSLEVKRRIDQLLTAVESRRRLRPPPSSFPVLFQPLNAERKSVDSLIRATEDPQRRLDAVRALGLLGPAARKAESVLQQLRRDDEPAVRQAAQTALWQIEE